MDVGKRRQHKVRTYDLHVSLRETSASHVRGDWRPCDPPQSRSFADWPSRLYAANGETAAPHGGGKKADGRVAFMAIYHCSTKPLARSSGRSAVAAAAYRSGDRLVDERQGLEHDYTRRRGVVHSELVLPEGAGAWSRAELWNAAEQAEKRKDARTAREWEIALPSELSAEERRELAVGFARELVGKYGCAVDVALHSPDREGDQRNWHAHLLATTRKVWDDRLGDKCEIELSDSKRLFLGLAPARIEVEAVRQMWADQVNRRLAEAQRTERVDHRSLAAQREEAIQKGDEHKAAELDRAPQVKLGWKVVQMERRGEASDRGNQLRQVGEENRTRQAVVLDIGQLRDQLARRQAEEAARRREAEEKKLLADVEAEFIGKGPIGRDSVLKRWRTLAQREIPDLRNARTLWEQDRYDPEASAWRETRNSIEWETQQTRKAARAIDDWHTAHPVQSLMLRAGLKKTPTDLAWLEQQHAANLKFLEGSERRLKELEENWATKKSLQYQQQLERDGEGIRRARRALQIIDKHSDHFRQLWQREEQAFKRQLQQQERERNRRRSRDRDRGGWSR